MWHRLRPLIVLVNSQRSSDNFTLGGTVTGRPEIHRCVYLCTSLGQCWKSLCSVHVYTCRRQVFTYRNHIISETHQQCLWFSLGISISPRGIFLCLKLNWNPASTISQWICSIYAMTVFGKSWINRAKCNTVKSELVWVFRQNVPCLKSLRNQKQYILNAVSKVMVRKGFDLQSVDHGIILYKQGISLSFIIFLILEE